MKLSRGIPRRVKQGPLWIILLGWFLLIPNTTRATSNRPGITPTGAAAGDFFGTSVGTAGDVNGDGYADVIVGAPNNDVGGSNAGRAYVYFGGPGADAIGELTLTGESPDDQFGHAVGTAGDVNGDGFDDIIVGAPYNDSGGSNAGRVYVYFGGSPNLDAMADLTLTGPAAGAGFGWSVATAGDVNGDGYTDVLVGAPSDDQGRVYVFFGGPAMDTVADLTLSGEAIGDHFGTSVAAAGDVTGDGYADWIVGATGYGGGIGRAYVYYGGVLPDATPDLALTGPPLLQCFGFPLTTWFGESVAAAGDVNGDGFADVIVGAHQFSVISGACSVNGRAYVYHGGPGADAVADMTVTGLENDHLGISVGTLGDVNRDGYSDIFAGAYDLGGQSPGRTYVYYGGLGDAVPDLLLTGEAAGDRFGYSVASAGDVEGDGYADLIVGAFGNDAAGLDAGRAYVTSFYDFKLLSPNGGEQWVAGASTLVRWLGRDAADLSISFDGGTTYTTIGRAMGGGEENSISITVPLKPTEFALVRVSYAGENSITRTNSDESDKMFRIVLPKRAPSAAARLARAFAGVAAEDNLGTTVSDAGDVNGDGYADVIVGSYLSDDGGADAGRAYVYFGGPGSDAAADMILPGAAGGDNFGVSVSGAGDVNGDGHADVIVGAWLNDLGGTDAGAAYVHYGGPATGSVTELTGTESFGFFGSSVSGAGDVNGDGYADVIVGAFWEDAGGPDAGRSYVYFGGPFMDTVADLTLNGEAAGDNFAVSVSGAGDVNGDGYADVAVGAWLNDAGGMNAGRAYVYYGGSAADAVADLVLTGAAANDNFGHSVSGTADVNGDGFADVVVGAPLNDVAGPDAGRAYVFFGGPGADAAADLILTGQAAGDQFGVSVSGAGDVNGDGFADVVVGAYANDAGGSEAGRAYVYYGGPGGDAVADQVLTGAAGGDQFGISVSGAGDVNGDGHADLIIGAYGSDPEGILDAGQAYLYDSNRYFITTPNGGETWNVGARKTLSWLGAEPAKVSLSVDGGQSYTALTPSAVGGSASNSITIQVPHSPTKFAKIQVTPFDSKVGGVGRSDSLFTIQTSVALLAMLAAPLPEGAKGATISWQTDPGPEDLAGYRLERAGTGSADWRTVVALTRETSHTDPDGGPGSRYRLFAVNGLGEELWLGEAAIRPLTPLAAWPLPYRGGPLTVSFATGGFGGGDGRTEISVYDVSGRLVRRIDSGVYPAGYRVATWDGRNEHGRDVAPGIYFLHAKGDFGYRRTMKISVLR